MKVKVTATSKQLSFYKSALKKFNFGGILIDDGCEYAYIEVNTLDELIVFKEMTKRKHEIHGELILTNDDTTGETIIEIYDYYQ